MMTYSSICRGSQRSPHSFFPTMFSSIKNKRFEVELCILYFWSEFLRKK